MKDKFCKLLGQEWFDKLENYFDSEYFQETANMLSKERRLHTVYPEQGSDLLFKAFRTTPFSKVKVVILGQDPYHDGSYDGFAFSNKGKEKLSPSLQNILKEVESDAYNGFRLDQEPDLQRWAEQGVLLINTAHTVRKGEPASHLHLWEHFTKTVLYNLGKRENPMVWMLWGGKAKRLAVHFKSKQHLILTAAHPSPFSAANGFFDCKHFTQCNAFLTATGQETIKW